MKELRKKRGKFAERPKTFFEERKKTNEDKNTNKAQQRRNYFKTSTN